MARDAGTLRNAGWPGLQLSDDEFAEAKKLVLDGIGQKPAAGEFVGHYEVAQRGQPANAPRGPWWA